MFCYLDNAATTRPYDEVIQYMMEVQEAIYGNPSSLHSFGVGAEKEMSKAREIVAHSLNISAKEIVFTSSATEANNLAVRGFLNRNHRVGRHIITSEIEHPSILELCKDLEKNGYEIDRIKVEENGQIDMDHLRKLLRQDTALVSVMYVNNETGAIQPIEKIKKAIHEAESNAVLHVDAVQGFAKHDFAPHKLGVDSATISAHKFHGPKGAAALYIKSGIHIDPIIFGGGQERGLRSGTENVPAIAGFAKATEIAGASQNDDLACVLQMRETFLNGLEVEGLVINSDPNGSPYILNFAIPGIRSEVMLHHLESVEVIVSTGSACASSRKSESHVLRAMGKSRNVIDSSIRVSFGKRHTRQEIEYAVGHINAFSSSLRRKR